MVLLVTGGTGFLGSYLTRHALAEGGEDHVVILDRYVERGRIPDVLDRVTIIEGDVADGDLVAATIKQHGIDRIAHFAFILGQPAAGQMVPYVRVQTLGIANLLECARAAGVRRVLFASSVAAYGRQDAAILDETLIPRPADMYGASKLWGETLANVYTEQLGLEVVTLRYGSTFGLGRGLRGSYKSGLMAMQASTHYMARVEPAARGEAVTMPRGDALADWTYAADGAQAAWLALTADGLPYHLFNVGSARGPIAEFTQAMRDLLPGAIIAESEIEGPGNAHLPMSNGRLLSIGYTPRYSIHDGVADYIRRIELFDRYYRSA